MVRPETALDAWPELAAGAELTPITTGLINATFRIDSPAGTFALQRLSPIFGREVHDDIEAVTGHLEARGLLTPRLVRTADGALDHDDGDGVWRVLTWIDGQCVDRLTSDAQACSAGALLGRFHAALADLEHAFVHRRIGVHDTAAHLGRLRAALRDHAEHPEYDRVAPLGEAILREAETLPTLPLQPERVVHGDPKVNNLLFDRNGRGVALVDLDTVARMPLVLELGDAFRSWCNPSGEDATEARFATGRFEAALDGYFSSARAMITEPERAGLVGGTRTIMVELAARFCWDALEDRYFGWDRARFPSRSAHNQVRARGQLALARALAEAEDEAEAAVARAWTRALAP